jgi:hypothetical protein
MIISTARSEPKPVHNTGFFDMSEVRGVMTDLKITTETDFGHVRVTWTEYFAAGFERVDQFDPDGRPQYTTLKDLARARVISWHADRPEYVVMRLRTPAPPKLPSNAPKLSIGLKAVDTGEQKPFLGKMARHLVTEETRHWSNSPLITPDSTTRVDGWYVDSESLPASKQHPVGCALVIEGQQPRIETTHTDPMPSGVAMVAHQTTMQKLPDSLPQVVQGGTTRVIEWSEGPLSEELFRPPAGYRRVIALGGQKLNWRNHLRFRWEIVEDWARAMLLRAARAVSRIYRFAWRLRQ